MRKRYEKDVYIYSEEFSEWFNQRGGNPKIVDVLAVMINGDLNERVRYKIEFPDGTIDYVNIKLFNECCEFLELETCSQ